jgi:hypothetical protein
VYRYEKEEGSKVQKEERSKEQKEEGSKGNLRFKRRASGVPEPLCPFNPSLFFDD